jgi:flagellar hook-associated protein 2
MMCVPALKTNSYWSTLQTSSLVNDINYTSPQDNKWNNNFQSLIMFSKMSSQKYQDQQNHYKSAVSSFTGSAKGLTTSVKSLTVANSFNQKSVSATGTAVTGTAKNGAALAQYSVSVSQVATSQKNEGKTVSSAVYGGGTAGKSTFGIKVGSGLEHQVSVNTSVTDTNGQVLKKFANAINNSGAGVVAEIKTKNNGQYLSISSKDTGAASAFSIRDINGSGVADLQLNNKVTDAADAKYSVDGTNYQTASNNIVLDNGNVSLTINAAATGAIKVNVGKDESSIVVAAKGVVDNYNRMNDVLSNADNNITKRGETALNGVKSLVGTTKMAEFAAVGISMNKDTGALQVDEKKLSDALASHPDQVQGLLTGNGSLGKAVEHVAKEIANTPVSSYVTPPNVLGSISYGYSGNYGSQYSMNNWISSQNSITQGLFLNMMM